MESKKELQSVLKKQYGINKNISNALDAQQCEQLIEIIKREQAVRLITESFAKKNVELGKNNAFYGGKANRVEKKLNSLQTNYQELVSIGKDIQLEFEKQITN